MSEYIIPKTCEKCGSDDLAVRVIYEKGILRYMCLECGWSRSLPKEENLKRRFNTTLAHWAKGVIAQRQSCSICGSVENLEAHHIIPVSHSERFKYVPTNGITLCRKCHYLVHHKEVIESE